MLRRFRAREGFQQPFLWVDAVCIDQTNVSEREAQVKLMSWIYRESKATITDVREQSEGEEHIVPLLDSVIDVGEICDAIAMSLEDSPNNASAEEHSIEQAITDILRKDS